MTRDPISVSAVALAVAVPLARGTEPEHYRPGVRGSAPGSAALPLSSAVRLCLTGEEFFPSAATPPFLGQSLFDQQQRHSRMLEEGVCR
jgi:hypothetical protein